MNIFWIKRAELIKIMIFLSLFVDEKSPRDLFFSPLFIQHSARFPFFLFYQLSCVDSPHAGYFFSWSN